jgi:formyltetrahydrofolate deformylase
LITRALGRPGDFAFPVLLRNLSSSIAEQRSALQQMKQFANITVIGRDKTGVVARVTNFLFEQSANIEALEEQVTRGQFSMTIQASWKPSQFRQEAIKTGLVALGKSLEMEIKLQLTQRNRKQRAALFVTREPHCFEELMRGFKSGALSEAEPRIVISNRPDLKPLADQHRLPFIQINWEDRVKAETATIQALDEHEIDFIVLARFMKILSPSFVWRYKNKIINVHPSLLPSFPGPQAYRQAYEHGVKIIGVTSHFVSMHLDEGPIIAQESFHVRPNMSLKDIVAAGQKREAKVLVRAVRLFLKKRLDVYWGIVKQV